LISILIWFEVQPGGVEQARCARILDSRTEPAGSKTTKLHSNAKTVERKAPRMPMRVPGPVKTPLRVPPCSYSFTCLSVIADRAEGDFLEEELKIPPEPAQSFVFCTKHHCGLPLGTQREVGEGGTEVEPRSKLKPS
jgi:hypothetical protein